MPIYEYRCGDCGHELEAMQKMSDPVLETCPGCSRDALKRLISAPSFRLKGGGWYETDFKKDGKRNVHKADSKAESSAPPCATGACPAASNSD
jgi:putative FmdB family regulatory protein